MIARWILIWVIPFSPDTAGIRPCRNGSSPLSTGEGWPAVAHSTFNGSRSSRGGKPSAGPRGSVYGEQEVIMDIANLPAPVLIVLFVLIPVFLSNVGLVVVHRLFPHELRAPQNEVAGFVYACIGVIYAVVLA